MWVEFISKVGGVKILKRSDEMYAKVEVEISTDVDEV